MSPRTRPRRHRSPAASRGSDSGGYARAPAAAGGGGLGRTRRGWVTTRYEGNVDGARHARGCQEGGLATTHALPGGPGLRLAQARNCPTRGPHAGRAAPTLRREMCHRPATPRAHRSPQACAVRRIEGIHLPTSEGCVQKLPTSHRPPNRRRGDWATPKLWRFHTYRQGESAGRGRGSLPPLSSPGGKPQPQMDQKPLGCGRLRLPTT